MERFIEIIENFPVEYIEYIKTGSLVQIEFINEVGEYYYLPLTLWNKVSYNLLCNNIGLEEFIQIMNPYQ